MFIKQTNIIYLQTTMAKNLTVKGNNLAVVTGKGGGTHTHHAAKNNNLDEIRMPMRNSGQFDNNMACLCPENQQGKIV
jgi:hypothetical protein